MMNRILNVLQLFSLLSAIGGAIVSFPYSSFGKDPEKTTPLLKERHYPFAKGELKKVDLNKRSLVIQTHDGLKTFLYTDRTYFFRMSERVRVDQLQTGDFIRLNFYLDPQGSEVVRRLKAEVSSEPEIQDDASPPIQPIQKE